MSIRSVVCAICALALVVPAGAGAATPSSAQRFADAALRLKVAVNARKADFAAAYAAIDHARCERAFERIPPKREIDNATTILVLAASQPLVEVGTPLLRQMVRDLEAIPTNDPALRSGRAGWREAVALVARYPRLDRPCEALERWSRAGWRPSARPDVSFRELQRFVTSRAAPEAKLHLGARRLRQLGISAFSSKRFIGETIFEDVIVEPAVDLAAGD